MTAAPGSATMANVRTFNTTGPVVAADHYRIPPLERIDLDTVLGLIRDKKYFVLHAPRQTGKTSALLELRDLLNDGGQGDFRCVYANVEAGQAMRDNVTEGHAHRPVPVRAQGKPDAGRRHAAAGLQRGDEQRRAGGRPEPDAEPLGRGRPQAAGAADRRDRRAGGRHPAVGAAATAQRLRPASVSLPAQHHPVRGCATYATTASTRPPRTAWCSAASAFNIKSESLRLGNFSEQEIRALLAQHTAATGQGFTEEALALIGARTGGQPWLVNALCYDACFRHPPGRDRTRPVTAAAIQEAQERLILRRDTHIDDLAYKLREERVRRVVEPILTGADQQACQSPSGGCSEATAAACSAPTGALDEEVLKC